MNELNGKVALVTGASKGIGAGIARGLARAGASVAVNYATSREGADRVVAEITSKGGKAITVRGDVAKAADVQRMFAETKKAFGRLDILVNNAGVYEFQPLEEITEEHFHRHFDTNVLGLLLASREALRYFDGGGSIINVSSTTTSITPPASSVYTATKGAVDAITRTLAKELGPRNIRVNAINPGMVLTEGVRSGGYDQGEFREQMEAQTPLRRIGEVDDVVPAAVFLASADSGWITGETLRIAGGLR
jgi:3-oxoacyl-[acyl-carrier protein] reductase